MSSPDYKAARRALRAYLAAPDRHPPLAYAVQILLRAERTHRKTTIPTLERLYRQEQEQMRLARAENKSLRESISRLREKPPFQPVPADYQALRDANNKQAETIRNMRAQLQEKNQTLMLLPTYEVLAAERKEARKVRADLAAAREELARAEDQLLAAQARTVSVPALRKLVEERGRKIRELEAELARPRDARDAGYKIQEGDLEEAVQNLRRAAGSPPPPRTPPRTAPSTSAPSKSTTQLSAPTSAHSRRRPRTMPSNRKKARRAIREFLKNLSEKNPDTPTDQQGVWACGAALYSEDLRTLLDSERAARAEVRTQAEQIQHERDSAAVQSRKAAEAAQAAQRNQDAYLRERAERLKRGAGSPPPHTEEDPARLREERDRARQRLQEAQEQLRRAQPEKVSKTYADILKEVPVQDAVSELLKFLSKK